MDKYTCKHCKTTFTSKYTLARHQRRARYCLQRRGLETEDVTCKCGRSFGRKDDLQYHQKTCSRINATQVPSNSEAVLLKVIEEYSDMVKEFQKQVAELSARPTNVTNNNNSNNVLNNLQPITDEDLQAHLVNLTIDFIQEGAKGYADFAGNYPFKDKILCTDRSRKKLRYRGPDGELTDDGRALAQRFFQAISERNTEVLNEAYSDLQHQLQDIVSRGRAGDEDVTGILTKATELQDILMRSQRAATGQDDNFAQEFLSHLAKRL